MPIKPPVPPDSLTSVVACGGDEASLLPLATFSDAGALPGCMPDSAENKDVDSSAMPKPCALHASSEKGAEELGNQRSTATEEPGSQRSAEAEELLQKILGCDQRDIDWILRTLMSRFYPELAKQLKPPTDTTGTTREGSRFNDDLDTEMSPQVKKPSVKDLMKTMDAVPVFDDTEDLPSRRPSGLSCAPIIQFSSFMYFCSEEEGTMVVDVMRIGNLHQRSEVRYTTVDVTAKAGVKYLHTEGKLVFEPEDSMCEIQIPILNTDRWETTVEFKVQLLEEGKINGTLGFYLYQSRVKIIDADSFPTNKFENQIQELVGTGNRNSLPKQALLLEYFKMSWADPDIKASTIKLFMFDSVHNLIFLLSLFLNVYLVDFVLNEEVSEDAFWFGAGHFFNQLVIVLATLFGFIFQHAVDYRRLNFELDAGELQRNLLRKFLNYDESARSQLHEASLVMAMTRDSVKLVAGGYMQLVPLARALGKLSMILVYQFASQFAFGTTESFSDKTFWFFSFAPLVVLPAIQITYMSLRRSKNTYILADRNVKEDAMINYVSHTSMNYRLIADYNRRPQTVRKFQGLIDEYADACTVADQVITNNDYFQTWVTQVLMAIITLGLGNAVTSSDYPLGMFLINVSLCGNIGECFGEIYQCLMSMEKVLPALLQITWLMNLPTDLSHRMALNRNRRRMTTILRAERLSKPGTQADDVPIDTLNIRLRNVNFAYNSKGRLRTFEFQGTLDIKQGSLVAFVGRRGEGKTTLLKILGGVILPQVSKEAFDQGQEFYMPSHLRVLHVSTDPIFFHGTLRSNMVFGVPGADHPDAKNERVRSICEKLLVPEEVLSFLEKDEELDWNEVFSQTENTLLSLARAIVSNPEVLCIHKPTLTLDPNGSVSVLKVLHDYVRHKGICQDPHSIHMRRPRTCMITISRTEALKVADRVYLVQPNRVCPISWQNVTPDLLQ